MVCARRSLRLHQYSVLFRPDLYTAARRTVGAGVRSHDCQRRMVARPDRAIPGETEPCAGALAPVYLNPAPSPPSGERELMGLKVPLHHPMYSSAWRGI